MTIKTKYDLDQKGTLTIHEDGSDHSLRAAATITGVETHQYHGEPEPTVHYRATIASTDRPGSHEMIEFDEDDDIFDPEPRITDIFASLWTTMANERTDDIFKVWARTGRQLARASIYPLGSKYIWSLWPTGARDQFADGQAITLDEAKVKVEVAFKAWIANL
jgi:hypothetical protein